MQTKRRVGILGGSFDPPTLGHIQLAAETINLRHVDEAWIIPCGVRKDKILQTPGEHRLKMTEILVKSFFGDDFPIKVKDIEIKNGETIPTYTLMRKLMDDPELADYDFYFILGSDLLPGLKNWRFAEKLIAEIKFIIFIRIGFKLEPEVLPSKYVIVHTTFVASSSSEIRTRVRAVKKWGHADPSFVESQDKKKESNNMNGKKEEKQKTDLNGQNPADLYTVDNTHHLRKMETIVFPEDAEANERRFQLENRYLSIYGIVPKCIIEYIHKHNLYDY